MEDLQTADISLSPEYVTKHLLNLKKGFSEFKAHIDKEYNELIEDNKFIYDKFNFDISGESNVLLSSLTDGDKKLKGEIEKKFSSSKFFKIKNDRIYNRQQVYYSVIKDEPRIYQAIKTFIYLDSSLVLIQEMDKKDFVSGSFVIASILDDIRYKLILLFEDVLIHKIPIDTAILESLVDTAISNYYSYILDRPQTTISYSQLLTFTSRTRDIITDYLNNFNANLGAIKRYKEGDVPSDNLLFIHKLKKCLPAENVDIVAGIRFGGIELPYLVKQFIYPKAKVKLEKISNYSDNDSGNAPSINTADYKGKNVLVVDDGITTGRTIKKFIEAIKNHSNNIFFASVYYSGYKRIKHMQMEGHGGVNLEQLKKCCVLKETNYTAPVNKTSYTNRKGKFDKTKAKVEAKADLGQTLFDLETPIEDASQKEENTKKVFIACSLSYITESYEYLINIRNKYQKHTDYEIIDDWLVNRIEKIGTQHFYKEVPGRNFLYDAIRDIDKSGIVVLFCPGPSAYLSSLFLVATMKEKEVTIFYRKKEDIEDFTTYSKATLIQIMKMKTAFVI
jgi:hypoxanthine phosphoribosyltransferase